MEEGKIVDFLGLTETAEAKNVERIDGILIDSYISEIIIKLNKIGLRTTVSCSGLNEDHEDTFDDRTDGYLAIVILPQMDLEVFEAFVNIANDLEFELGMSYHPWLGKETLRIGNVDRAEKKEVTDVLRKKKWDMLLIGIMEFVCDEQKRRDYLKSAPIRVSQVSE